MSMQSSVPRWPEEHRYERVLGPDTYEPWDPCNPKIHVKERSRRNANFRSLSEQRPPIISERTEPFVAPGSYSPSYVFVHPDVSRLEQFATKKTSAFASRHPRFKASDRQPPPDVTWSLETDAAQWTCNRSGGGCWAKAPRDSGVLALVSKRASACVDRASDDDEPRGGSQKPLSVPLDYCFKELTECSEVQREEPVSSYSGALPRRIKLPVS